MESYIILDEILWHFPLLSCFMISLLCLRKSTLQKSEQHKYLFHLFNILLFTFLAIFLYNKQAWVIISYFFVMTMPINLLLFPVFYFFIYSLINRRAIDAKTKMWHLLPSFIVFVLFLPFLICSDKTRVDFVTLQLLDNHSHPIIEYITILRKVSLLGLFNLQFLFYFILILITISGRKVRKTQFYVHTKISDNIILSLVFFTLLMVLINYSYYLGVQAILSSRIMFNVISSILILVLFLWGYYQKPIYTMLKQHGSEKESM
ncbi:hypothetical protein DSECCO2_520620 [anaerobic digester metagenome]